MTQNLKEEIDSTFGLFDSEFTGSGIDLTEAVLLGIENERKEQSRQRQRNAAITAILVLLILLNIFAVQTAVSQTSPEKATSVSQASVYSGLEATDLTILINKKITSIANGK